MAVRAVDIIYNGFCYDYYTQNVNINYLGWVRYIRV